MNHLRWMNPMKAALVAAALLVPAAADAPATLTITAKDAKKTHVLKVGNTLDVRLQVQMGTGYAWKLAKPTGEALVQDGEAKVEPQAKDLPGGAETQVFRFTAKAAGKAELAFECVRSFEPGQKPLKAVTFQVEVKANGK